ncbi:hypothetical protein EC957_011445 [Mortierella hygrophila]|uniref:WSC domain-containing protein n=1 Tax=Mortierella hygrophila TaxID=979708 RepID=A0A9P6FHH3_9FUNG|nr:hypothetical protein EC957_011445 [Mortierella hygrophila]
MRSPTFLSFITLAAVMAVWTTHTVHGQISVGCFQNQLDSSTGASDIKSYQDIYMSQGACTNYCRTSGTAYALTMDGSTCHCSNSAPMDSNKIDDAKCDKPCMGYPFEMCGGSSSRSIANVLLIGSSTAVPGGAGGGGSTSTSNGTGAATTAPTASESSKKSQNDNSSNNSNGGGNGASTTTTTTDSNGGKALNTDTGMFPRPRPTTSPTHEHEPGVHDRDREGRLKKETSHLDASSDMDEDSSSGSEGGSSPGIIAASIAAIFGFAGLFAVAFVFSKRRRQRLSQAAWTENMLLPSSLIHTSANNDELEGHDYTRSSPIYHQHQHQNQHSNKQRESIPTPIPPPNMHFPPPLHPRQGGPLHTSQPSYPPPPPMMGIPGGGGGGHYHPMRGNPYQPFPLHAQRLSQQQQQYDPHLLIEQNLNHKEPLQASPPPPQFAPSFSRGPQSLQQGPPLPSGAIEHIRNNSEGGIEEENYERHDERSLSHHPSIRSIRHDRQERGSVDSTTNILRVVNTDGSS